MNEFVRAVRLDDFEPLFEMIGSVTPGLTTLMLDRAQLLERIERSHFAFTRKSESHSGEPYVLVMEDGTSGRLVGTSTVYGKTGGYEPFYAYRVVTTTHHCPQLAIHDQKRLSLHLQRIYDGPTEIGSLFLLPEFRGGGRGRLLSLARFALLAQRPHRFADRVIAEMRGRCDEDGVSPFWEAVMRPFFEVEFKVADALSTVSKPFIEELIPQYPLSLDLMPPAAREVIGRVHRETEPALRMLSEEGFIATDMVDIFDAGPVVQCYTKDIDAVRRCQMRTVDTIAPVEGGTHVIAASKHDGFRGLCGSMILRDDESSVQLEPAHAQTLGVSVGDTIWCMTPRPH